jgi:hypothetical protein
VLRAQVEVPRVRGKRERIFLQPEIGLIHDDNPPVRYWKT